MRRGMSMAYGSWPRPGQPQLPALCKSFVHHYCILQVRFLARGFSNPGDHTGQASHGYRWPYGPVALITPFNFPLEIPVLQVGPAVL